MHGYLVMTVTGTFNPNATCPAPCTGAGFIAAFFGPGATDDVPDHAGRRRRGRRLAG
jgi:hypothetical protein